MRPEDLSKDVKALPILRIEKDPKKREWLTKLMAAAGCALMNNCDPGFSYPSYVVFANEETRQFTATTYLAELLKICARNSNGVDRNFGGELISWDETLKLVDVDAFNSKSITLLVQDFVKNVLIATAIATDEEEPPVKKSEAPQWKNLLDMTGIILRYNTEREEAREEFLETFDNFFRPVAIDRGEWTKPGLGGFNGPE